MVASGVSSSRVSRNGRICWCGSDAVLRVSGQEHSRGRKFWTCPNSGPGKRHYFRWDASAQHSDFALSAADVQASGGTQVSQDESTRKLNRVKKKLCAERRNAERRKNILLVVGLVVSWAITFLALAILAMHYIILRA